MIGFAVETEIKLRLPDAMTGRRLLRKAGFRVRHRRKFESNWIYDTEDGLLRRRGEVLRLRVSGGTGLITFKGRTKPGRHKSREELETRVADPLVIDEILRRLGLQVVFRYEKYRTEYSTGQGTGVATLDETPIGVFFEIEGNPAWIDRTTKRLGFNLSDYITASYGRLYAGFRRERGLRSTNMVFPGRSNRSNTVLD